MTKVLVAYATRQGSTREVAEAVAPAIREQAVTVDRRPARAVRKSAIGCDLVVLGAPVYSGRWHRDAHRFLNRHRKERLHVPVAVFGMGPRDGTEDSWRRSRSQLDRALAKHQWLAPAVTALFGGVDPPRRPGQTTRPPGLGRDPCLGHRDPPARCLTPPGGGRCSQRRGRRAVTTSGRLAFISGQVALDPSGHRVGAGDLAAQTRQALSNLHGVLRALGADWPQVARLTWYVVDASAVQTIRDVRDELIGPSLVGVPNPASTLVQVGALARPELLVEVDAVVAVPDQPRG